MKLLNYQLTTSVAALTLAFTVQTLPGQDAETNRQVDDLEVENQTDESGVTDESNVLELEDFVVKVGERSSLLLPLLESCRCIVDGGNRR